MPILGPASYIYDKLSETLGSTWEIRTMYLIQRDGGVSTSSGDVAGRPRTGKSGVWSSWLQNARHEGDDFEQTVNILWRNGCFGSQEGRVAIG